MRKILLNPFVIIFVAILLPSISISFDIGKANWQWFQRSGSLVTILGAILTYRSFFRSGITGFGASEPILLRGIVTGYGENGNVQMKYDEESLESLKVNWYDKLAGSIGIFIILIGTSIWGYGDLLGRLFAK